MIQWISGQRDKYDGQIYSELEPFHFELKANAFFFFWYTLCSSESSGWCRVSSRFVLGVSGAPVSLSQYGWPPVSGLFPGSDLLKSALHPAVGFAVLYYFIFLSPLQDPGVPSAKEKKNLISTICTGGKSETVPLWTSVSLSANGDETESSHVDVRIRWGTVTCSALCQSQKRSSVHSEQSPNIHYCCWQNWRDALRKKDLGTMSSTE